MRPVTGGCQALVTVGDDEVLAVDVELYPTACRVQAGHRIRVQLSGGAFPRYARNLGTGEPFGAATRALRCRFEICHDSQHPHTSCCPSCPAINARVTANPMPRPLNAAVWTRRPHAGGRQSMAETGDSQ